MTSTVSLFERFGVIDVDTHITEPPGTWVDRMSSKWGDAIPHIERINDFDVWVVNGQPYAKPGNTAMAGFDGTLPDGPKTYADMHPAAWDPHARIRFMDEQHIRAQVLYPNLGGFGAGAWLDRGEPEYALDCLRAYNDFQTDFASIAPDRLLPITSIPFWDVGASITEIERCVGNGHRGINFCNQPEAYGQPPLWDPHWDPLWAATRDAGVPVNFHIGGGRIGELIAKGLDMGFRANFSRMSSMLFVDNLKCITDLIHGGVCHRFPDLMFVSVESGVGMIPGALEAFDWQWRNGGVVREHPEYDLLPSEYFRRQIHGCFWYERDVLIPALLAYPDNMMFETDFPHPTCQHPGPATPAVEPETYANEALASLPDDVLEKVLVSNAARLYRIAA
ncbi:MAG: amidohydrolase 2 [Ilumatobacteraceae bacterium]|nr:amidohydrolase 2 [Ilumatobacteraceae bacterium]